MLGEPLFFNMEVKNTGKGAVGLGPNNPANCVDEYDFLVQREGSGSCSTSWNAQCGRDFINLQSGESYSVGWPLEMWYTIRKLGLYHVTISYRGKTVISGQALDYNFSSKFDIQVVAADDQRMQEVLQKFERELQSNDPDVHHRALDVMSSVSSPYFYDTILRLARDKDAFNVLHAIGALRRMNTPDGRAALAEIIENRQPNSPDELTARESAIQALGESGDTSYLPLIASHTEESEPNVQLAAMIAVAQLSRDTAASELQRFLFSSNPVTRKNAAYGLRFAVSRSAVEVLIGALADKDAAVRDRVLTSLQQLTGRPADTSESALSLSELQNRWRRWWQQNSSKASLQEVADFFCKVE